MMRHALRLAAAVAFALTASATTALAHADEGIAHGIWHGMAHPVTGWDHLVAMIAVGLWGAFLGKRDMLVLPLVFPLLMTIGAAMAMAGISIPAVEIGIPMSAIVLGVAIALALRPPLWVAAIVVGAFAIFHGHAHGAEIPAATSPVGYAVGFVTATVLLHAAGIALGLAARWDAGRWAVRAAGLGIASVGLVFLGKSLVV